jgi:hypothetical protein
MKMRIAVEGLVRRITDLFFCNSAEQHGWHSNNGTTSVSPVPLWRIGERQDTQSDVTMYYNRGDVSTMTLQPLHISQPSSSDTKIFKFYRCQTSLNMYKYLVDTSLILGLYRGWNFPICVIGLTNPYKTAFHYCQGLYNHVGIWRVRVTK